jgi:protoporphyrinogen oxidase
MWERCAEIVEEAGTPVLLETPVVRITHEGGRATAVLAGRGAEPDTYPADHIVSSMPITGLVKAMDPSPPAEVLAAADDILYRDFLTVALVVPEEVGFPDNWIYIHAPEVEVGRIQNYGQWSPYMVKEARTCLGMEYFVSQGDELWDATDDDLVALATRELHEIGLVSPEQVEKGYVVRMQKTYPMYDEHYQDNVAVLRKWIETNTPNVHPVGRNGMHRYNNQDHSMFTAMLSVDNMFGGHHDVWSVNVEEEYHEEKATPSSGTGRDAPIIPRRALEGARRDR